MRPFAVGVLCQLEGQPGRARGRAADLSKNRNVRVQIETHPRWRPNRRPDANTGRLPADRRDKPQSGGNGPARNISGRLVRSPEYVFDLGTTVARAAGRYSPSGGLLYAAIVSVRPNAW